MQRSGVTVLSGPARRAWRDVAGRTHRCAAERTHTSHNSMLRVLYTNDLS
jgi:hypothetical protein